MKYGQLKISVAPIRKEPDNSSEQISQILFGEHFKILEKRAEFSKIRLSKDKYEGYLSNKQIEEISEQEYQHIEKEPLKVLSNVVNVIKNKDTQEELHVLIGSSLPENYELLEGKLSSGEKSKNEIVKYSKIFLNSPYLWGGRSFFGIDCSGFAQICYSLSGVKIPRDSNKQAEIGTALSFIEEAEAGDLAFFDNQEGNITHVGIILDDRKIIHCSGFVKIDQIDQTGIFDSKTKKYTHKLRVIKRIF